MSKRTAAFTILSPNYRHFARVLMQSLRAHHPEWDRFALFVGDDTLALDEQDPYTAVSLQELPLPHAPQFLFRYTILELNTAVKPWMFEHVFARGYDRVLYFDPDILLFSRLEELDASPPALLTLTPHLTGSIPGDLHPSERTILQAGTYNLGFLGVERHPSLDSFLRWWQDKLEHQCVVDVANGLFVDQKWIDLTPGMFPDVRIVRHEGYNVAYWNTRQRTVSLAGDLPTVNGVPLRFFHFSGADLRLPDLVSRNDPRQTIDNSGDTGILVSRYLQRLRAAGAARFRRTPYSFGRFHDGSPISDAARVAYRQSEELQAAAGADPFAHPELFVRQRPRPMHTLAQKLSVRSYQTVSKLRPLVSLVPRSLRKRLRERLLGQKDESPVAPPLLQSTGVTVAGYIHRPTGVGQSARLAAASFEEVDVVVAMADVDADESMDPDPAFPVSVFHVNADQALHVRNTRPSLFATGYRIACWHWELPEFPDAWIPSAEPFEEIWAPSLFVLSAVSRKVSIPVIHMPHGLEVTEIEPVSLDLFGVPQGRFTFLCMFDLDSVMDRKNPMGAIDAFRRAFPDASSTALVIKTTGADRHPEQFSELVRSLEGVSGIHILNRTMTRAQANGLVAACDGVVSLHRSEGFGLVPAEAMALGKPVIATGWSGNMDFMNASNSCPIDYELVPLENDVSVYTRGQRWAEPDLEHAAAMLRRVATDEAFRARIGARAAETMRTEFSPRAAGQRMKARLQTLGLLR